MKRWFTIIIILFTLILIFYTAIQDKETVSIVNFDVPTYKNPIFVPDGASVINIADPTVIKYNGEYYLYGTSDIPGFNVFHSRDLVNWEYKGVAYLGPPANGVFENVWNIDWFWAPAVYYYNGKFYMYYSAGDPAKGAESRNIGVAISDSPLGPFKDYEKNPIITNANSIDGFLFTDEDGEKYLYYNRVSWGFNGIVVRHMKDMFNFDTEETRVISVSEPWEGVINEGPVVFKKNGKYYLMYSGGNYADKTYAVGYATSYKPMGNLGMGDTTWKKYDKNPIMKTTDKVISPGHHDVVKAPNNVSYYMVYHTKRYEEPGAQRQLAIDRLYFNYDKLFTLGPTADNMPIPEKPDFQDWFDGDNKDIKEPWRVKNGEVKIKNDELVSLSKDGLIINESMKSLNYILEVNMKINDFDENSKVGFVASYMDDNNYIKFFINPKDRTAELNIVNDGKVEEYKKDLPKDFNINAYHQYLLYKNGKSIKVLIDNVPHIYGECNLGEGSAGLFFESSNSSFDGIAYTTYFEDNFDNDTGTFKEFKEEDGELKIEGASNKIFGEELENYELGFDIKFNDIKKEYGIYAGYKDDNNYIKLSIEGKAKGYFLKVEGKANKRKFVKKYMLENLTYGEFKPMEFHSIRIVKIKDIFAFYIDGKEITKVRFNLTSARVGLYNADSKFVIDNLYLLKLNY